MTRFTTKSKLGDLNCTKLTTSDVVATPLKVGWPTMHLIHLLDIKQLLVQFNLSNHASLKVNTLFSSVKSIQDKLMAIEWGLALANELYIQL